MPKGKETLKVIDGGKDKAPLNNELKKFTSLRAEVEAKLEANEAKFSAAEMGLGKEAELGEEYVGFLEEMKSRIENDEAYNAYDPFNKVYLTGGIKSQNQLQKYLGALTAIHEELEDLDSQFDIGLESGRIGSTVDDIMAA
jgi:hypothetical protein